MECQCQVNRPCFGKDFFGYVDMNSSSKYIWKALFQNTTYKLGIGIKQTLFVIDWRLAHIWKEFFIYIYIYIYHPVLSNLAFESLPYKVVTDIKKLCKSLAWLSRGLVQWPFHRKPAPYPVGHPVQFFSLRSCPIQSQLTRKPSRLHCKKERQ